MSAKTVTQQKDPLMLFYELDESKYNYTTLTVKYIIIIIDHRSADSAENNLAFVIHFVLEFNSLSQ